VEEEEGKEVRYLRSLQDIYEPTDDTEATFLF
jgi:hypothetical protein